MLLPVPFNIQKQSKVEYHTRNERWGAPNYRAVILSIANRAAGWPLPFLAALHLQLPAGYPFTAGWTARQGEESLHGPYAQQTSLTIIPTASSQHVTFFNIQIGGMKLALAYLQCYGNTELDSRGK